MRAASLLALAAVIASVRATIECYHGSQGLAAYGVPATPFRTVSERVAALRAALYFLCRKSAMTRRNTALLIA